MKRLTSKIKPASGFAHLFHIGLSIVLALLVFVLVRIDLGGLAVAVILLGKWRMFSVTNVLLLATEVGDALYLLVIGSWVVCYAASRHFFTGFDEPLTDFMSHVWGFFGASLVWVLGHWLLFYGVLSQPTLLLTLLGFGLASLYYLEKTDRLSKLMRRQVIFIILAFVIVILAFSNWGDKAV